MSDADFETFGAVKDRLDEIVEAVSDKNLPLDEALALYEEAVTLGLRASDLLEVDIEPEEIAELTSEDSAENGSTETIPAAGAADQDDKALNGVVLQEPTRKELTVNQDRKDQEPAERNTSASA